VSERERAHLQCRRPKKLAALSGVQMRSGVDRVAGQRRRAAKLVLAVQGDISAGSGKWWRSTRRAMDQGCCGSPARAADRGSARESRATGTSRRTGVANLGASAGAWAGDGRPKSAPESQIREESRAGGDLKWAGDSGARRRTWQIFWKRTAGASFRGIVAPVYSSRPTNVQ
jgi:hypothetical protein